MSRIEVGVPFDRIATPTAGVEVRVQEDEELTYRYFRLSTLPSFCLTVLNEVDCKETVRSDDGPCPWRHLALRIPDHAE